MLCVACDKSSCLNECKLLTCFRLQVAAHPLFQAVEKPARNLECYSDIQYNSAAAGVTNAAAGGDTGSDESDCENSFELRSAKPVLAADGAAAIRPHRGTRAASTAQAEGGESDSEDEHDRVPELASAFPPMVDRRKRTARSSTVQS